MTITERHKEKEKELMKKMRQLHIYLKDIKETFVKSSGPGGQNVNKVSTCVVLKHIPTGISVKCQEERSQAMNRYKARRLLLEKIEQQMHEKKLLETQNREKRRRQTRKRPSNLKEEILRRKHMKSEKKVGRRKIRSHKLDDYM